MMNNIRAAKKRKANDGLTMADNNAHDMNAGSHDGGSSFLSSWFGYFSGRRDDASSRPPSNENLIQQSLSKMDRMEKIMMRMEEKLATVSSLESRCEELERKCSSLETMLKSTSESTKEHIDKTLKHHEMHNDKTLKYHEMLIRNQKWEYSAHMYTVPELMDGVNYDSDEAGYIFQMIEILKENTIALRRGDFPDDYKKGIKGISFDININEYLPPFDEIEDYQLLDPHWAEFAAALTHFKPVFDVLPDDCKTFISCSNLHLNHANGQLIKEALMGMPFKRFHFEENCQFDGGMNIIAAMMDNNTHLQDLEFHRVQNIMEFMDRNDIAALSSAIQRHPSLVRVSFYECFSDGRGDDMLRSLLRAGGVLKLERLSMLGNHLLGSGTGPNDACAILADFLATNPRLTDLHLDENELDNNDAVLIAHALRSNTNLRDLTICGNDCNDDGIQEFFRVLYDESSLNSTADSNHSCSIDSDFAMIWNDVNLYNSKARDVNRAEKLYSLLSTRNKTMSNVKHFGDIHVKLLPRLLEVIQKYSPLTEEYDVDVHVKALSIVYEIMCRWDKVLPLYESLGNQIEP